MLLRREGVKYRRILREGNELLRVRYEDVGGECPAAVHVAALVRELVGYAEGALAEKLIDEGALRRVPFCRYRYEIDWREEATSWGSAITLTALLARGKEVLTARTLMTCWDEKGEFQKSAKYF